MYIRKVYTFISQKPRLIALSRSTARNSCY